MPHSHRSFLESAYAFDGAFGTTDDVLAWLAEQAARVRVSVERTSFAALGQWGFDEGRTALRHASGRFFSIEGIHVRTNSDYVAEWDQPIINQPEVGYLGFLTREIGGVLHFLVQAKIEPGNLNAVQLSPTLQATRSNYTRVHGGSAPAYLEYFQDLPRGRVLVDQLQSEQGARFLKKRNRNIIVRAEDDVPVRDNFIWLTLGQIKELMRRDNVVNMDTRTVIAGIPFRDYDAPAPGLERYGEISGASGRIHRLILESAMHDAGAIHGFDELLAFITRHKTERELDVEPRPLGELAHWTIGEDEIFHDERKFFRVIATAVEIENREVTRWAQPMVESAQEGICAFVCREIDGVLHFAVQAKLECGNFDVIELAPTVQCLTGNYNTETSKRTLPFLEYVLSAPRASIVLDVMQSEEGGRFFREQNRNLIVIAGDEVPIELPDTHVWMTLHQLHTFIKFNNYLNIQARSLLAAIPFAAEHAIA